MTLRTLTRRDSENNIEHYCADCNRSSSRAPCPTCVNKRNILILLCAHRYDPGFALRSFPVEIVQCVLVRVLDDALEEACCRGNLKDALFFHSRGLAWTDRAVHMAVANGRAEIVRFLLSERLIDDVTEAVKDSIRFRKRDVFDVLLLLGQRCDIQACLECAVSRGDVRSADALVREHGGDVRGRTVYGDTLLHTALYSADRHFGVDTYPTMRWLVESGVEHDAKNDEGKTIYDLCTGYYWGFSADWWTFLRDEMGVDCNGIEGFQ